MRNYFGTIILLSLTLSGSLIWLTIGFKGFVLFVSIFCILMWLNISFTMLGNAIIGHVEDINYDLFWKMLFILLASVGFGVYLNL